jgi:hypothetical protein
MSEIIYEFRPLPDYFRGGFRRYAEGKWIPDDGEYDLAFISSGYGAPMCLYVETPHYPNIICSWVTTHWAAYEPKHPHGNAWHYALKDYSIGWGPSNENYRKTTNALAGESGMTELCRKYRCANGDYVEFHADDAHIAAGLLRNRQTKEMFKWPEGMTCMYCGAIPVLPTAKPTEAVAKD